MKKSSGKTIKSQNINLLRHTLKTRRAATKSELATATNLSVVTVNALLSELIETGEVKEGAYIPSTGGRRAINFSYHAEFRIGLVLLLNETDKQDSCTVYLINLHGETVYCQVHATPGYTYQDIESITADMIAQHPQITAIGIGIPGQPVKGKITVSSHEKLNGIQLAQQLESQFGIPVALENDINAAVNGYCTRSQHTEKQSVAGIYFPRNSAPGMGLYINGRIERGKDGLAGEIKYLPIAENMVHGISPASFPAVYCYLLHIVTIILAPHQIIIYQQSIADEQLQTAWEAYQTTNTLPSVPEIVYLDTFHQDFLKGIKALTLEQLENVLMD
ncbi:ROK family protein [Gracilibacillus alcaliphilus]|uniref:ROK family protein n=1 Tax=Gracilibacillus alcaliphilus TaxID=1401441 RepID=UPI0019590181|nr:ROK family protein [Gracilibacillus alcaliphilus]MBM7678508.1 hypothetical protein [Gracilibacillus alcaliphilus]